MDHRPHPLAFLGSDIRTVLDIGANTGQFAREARLLFPHAFIHSFEPIEDCFERLRAGMYADSRFRAHKVALGNETGSRRIHVRPYSPSSSLLSMSTLHEEAFPHTRGGHYEDVEVRRLDDVAPELGIDGTLLVKMDAQGFERDIISGGSHTIRNARAVLSETSFKELYRGQPLFSDIHDLMHVLGFSYAGSLGQKTDPRDGRILIQDSLFLKP